ncbi:hypothetical protein IKG68_03255 [Candidatus Saccharibacteria bacterium]|nr:hypothetical protein [Candidatus Saccharibacteria bacterium]
MVNRKSTKPSSKSIHAKRPSVRSSGPATARDRSRRLFSLSRRTILTIIILAMIAVIATVIISHLTTPERTVTNTIESLATDYYENYFYDEVGRYNTSGESRTDILTKYSEKGFTAVTLKQLLYFDNERHISDKPTLSEYCDLDRTYVRITPIAPFGRTDYRVDYFYSCAY